MNSPPLLARIRIVLSHPSHPGNIGAVARAMKTMGLSRLILVAPKHFPDPDADARAFGALDVYRTSFRPLRHTLSGRDEKTLMKLVVDRASQRVVGAHMVGPEAGEIIQGIAIALKCRATKAQFDATIGIHPTGGGIRYQTAV
jgi:hypothetical protein